MTHQQLLGFYVNSAHASNQRRDYAAALKFSALATAMAPQLPEAWFNLALAEAGLGKRTAALRALKQASAVSAQSADAQSGIGAELLRLDALAEAEACLQRALALVPGHVVGLAQLGRLRQVQGRYEEAEQHFRHALTQQPSHAALHVNLGSALHEQERYDEAEAELHRAVELAPELVQAWKNLAVVLTSLKRDAEALRCYQRIIRLEPENPEAHWGLALLQIKSQEYGNGWKNFEYRWQVPDLNLAPLETNRPRWNGGRTDDRVLLWGEQGLGDQILFGSALPEAAETGTPISVALDKRLVPLFRRSMPMLDFLDLAAVDDWPDFQAQLPLGSLPLHFRRQPRDFIVARHPYLKADPARVDTLRTQIQRPGKRVCGISWSSTRKQLGRHKSLQLEELLVALGGEMLHFVNLQYGNTEAETEGVRVNHGIEVQSLSDVDRFNDIDGLAALIEACDIVITISNTTAHLAGALGKDTRLLLPWSEGRLWYWAAHDGRNPWYPSIRMYAQQVAGDWRHPVAAIRGALAGTDQ